MTERTGRKPGRRPIAETGESNAQFREAVLRSWANTTDRSARTAKARAAKDAKRLARYGNDPKRAAAALRADMIAMGRKGGATRRAQAEARKAAEADGAQT